MIIWCSHHQNHNLFAGLPTVSVIIAARNEEHNISKCIESLLALDYPEEKIEILIGNDASEDQTLHIAHGFQKRYPEKVKVFNIDKNVPDLKGKANVLAQLCEKANGQYYFFTDADIKVPKLWVRKMLNQFGKDVGIVTGFTGISGNSVLSILQNIDWFYALGILKNLSDIKMPATSMGNNMAISREAYWSTGGYQNVPFSITEDYALFKRILKRGYKADHMLDKEAICWSVSKESLPEILRQRKRWFLGGLSGPSIAVMTGGLFYALYYPSIALLFVLAPFWAFFIFLLKIVLQNVFILFVLKKSEVNIKGKYLLLYELYSAFLVFLMTVYLIMPFKLEWKGRKY